MEWILRSPQIHSTFGNLGFSHADGYYINENCNTALETILHNILIEDKYLRTYRRSISFGQNLKKDIIPLLIHAKEDKTIELLIKILVNLTIPIECLLSVEGISKTDFGRHTVFEINNLLTSTKVAFTDHRVTKVVIEFLKKNCDVEQSAKLTAEQCTNISNSLLLLRNILYIPEEGSAAGPKHGAPPHAVQNQILWNIFSQSIDKVLIKLMTIPEATNWGVTMVQLIALLYKDQHVVTLHKLLNQWLEASLSESSEDNESNTSPPDRGREDSSPMLTSDPTSDSSDNGGSGESNPESYGWRVPAPPPGAAPSSRPQKADDDMSTTCSSGVQSETASQAQSQTFAGAGGKGGEGQKIGICDTSDCGYGTQIENQESVSTSSNEDELPASKPVHQKPHKAKQRAAKPRPPAHGHAPPNDKKRKKIVKRAKANIINVQGLSHKTPTDDDISYIMKEFTVDFLLKGYNALVQTLHSQILTNLQLEIDTSHFFWLVTYFLKFATQIELDLEHVSSVLSLDIVTYLTAEGVNLCEQFELAIKLDGIDLKPSIRRLHLVVTAIREYVQAIEVYKKLGHVCNEDKEQLVRLQLDVCQLEELRVLLLLLLRHYNPKFHSKQYLQDLVVTNHILLLFVDSVSPSEVPDHLKQFATTEIMHQYGLLLEDYAENGEFVNDCIFTLMHHVGGELGSLISLFQPNILKTFTAIWESEFEICDDWSDLIEYVINTFIKKPHTLQKESSFRLNTESFEGADDERPVAAAPPSEASQERWAEEELSTLNWNYMQCNTSDDYIGDIVKLFKENGVIKSRYTVIKELYRQSIINKEDYDKLMIMESDKSFKTLPMTKEARDDEIGKLCEQLKQDGKLEFLDWVQKVLLETCFVKIYLDKKALSARIVNKRNGDDQKILQFELFKKKPNSMPVMSPVAYHCLLVNESVPLVPWNCAQAAVAKDLKFLQLLHRLGFFMPVDSGKHFIRIPHFWTPDYIYDIAGKIMPIDTTKLKFAINDISESGANSSNFTMAPTLAAISELPFIGPDNFYQVQKQNHHATMVNFTPMPSSSFHSEERPVLEPAKQNWLEVVQRSQEIKITLGDLTVKQPAPGAETLPAAPAALLIESEDNISVCDTASVASDLTRMYVSDEDEKPQVLLRSVAAPAARSVDSDLKPHSDPDPDLEPYCDPDPLEPHRNPKPDPGPQPEPQDSGARAGKRPRVQFAPTF